MEHYAITINRQFGSLGRPIAQKLSKILSIEYYDRDIVDNACRETGISIKEISDLEENAKSDYRYMRFPLGRAAADRQDYIFNVQSRFIQHKAEEENCIFVGRCADHILSGKENLLRIFIYAPYEARLRNCVETLRMDQNNAFKMIDSVDKARNLYHKKYTGYLPSDISHMDYLINSDFLGVDGSAELIAEIARKKFHLSEDSSL